MTKTLSLLLASAALTAGLGLPAWSAMHGSDPGNLLKPVQTLLDAGATDGLLVLVDDDEDDDDDEGGSMQRGESDDDDDDEDCDDDEGSCNGAAAGPAPAGSVAPPQNGLFDTGAPQVQVK